MKIYYILPYRRRETTMEEIAYIYGVVLEVLKGNLDAGAALEFIRDYLSRK